MSYITPKTNIYLYSNCPLPSNYEHTFYFANESAQTSYFAGLNPTPYNNNTYQVMSSGVVRIKDSIDNLYDKSYMSFVNTKSNGVGFENKTYYCFVTDVIYINNGTTEIHYTIDVMQTYLFQYKTGDGLGKKMFVDRCHISKSDDVLSNGIMMNDEGLDVGIDMQCEVVRRNAPELTPADYGDRGYVAFVFSAGQLNNPSNISGDIPNNLTPTEVEITYGNNTFRGIAVKTPENEVYYYMSYPFTSNGTYENLQEDKYIVSPLYCQEIPIYKADGTYATNASSGINNFSGLTGLYNYIRLFNALGKIDAIQKIIMMPGWMCYKNTTLNNRLKDPYGSEIETSISFNTTFGSYTPKNKKTLGYPYNYYTVDNNSNDKKVYKPQFFDNPETNNINFKYFGSIHYGEIWCYPLYYYTKTNEVQQQVYGLSKKVGVELPYINDSYNNWLANSTISRNLAINSHIVTSALSIASGVIGGDNELETNTYDTGKVKRIGKHAGEPKMKTEILGTGELMLNAVKSTGKAMSNSYNFISNLAQQKAEHAEIPTTLAGSFDENLGYIIDINGFTISRVRVTNAVAKRIDDYFSVYGYKIMDWQIPKLKVRSKWTFIKTAGCAIKPNNIPTQFEDAINQIFDNGITFWNDTTNFMDYGDFSNPD